MPIRPNRAAAGLLLFTLIGGFLTGSPVFGQYTIDLTDGVCSHSFLKSAKAVSRNYYEELGAPELLPEMIDSSFAEGDHISAITYIYIAHFDRGMEETYLADIARILASAGCFHTADSLFAQHLKSNPEDNSAARDYAILLAENWKFARARDILEDRIKDTRRRDRDPLYRGMGMVRLLEYLKTGGQKARREAFGYYRLAHLGSEESPTVMQKAILNFHLTPEAGTEDGKYLFTAGVDHSAGSDALITRIYGGIEFGIEIQSNIENLGPVELERLLGSVYLPPGEKLSSETGALEIAGDQGNFAPFYDGRIIFRLGVLFPGGSDRVISGPEVTIRSTGPSLKEIMDDLSYGETDWACSVLSAMADTGALLPRRWEASCLLSDILSDPAKWEDGLGVVDSLIEIELDANLWVYKGALLYNLRRPEEARHPLQQALEADPHNFWAMYNMALVERDLGHLEHSAQLFLKAAEINPQAKPVYLLAGVVYEEMGRFDLALENYRIALRRSSIMTDDIKKWIAELEGEGD